MCLGFSRTLAYPKYFSFLVSVCLRIDPISQISISTELSASGLMKACFEAATSEAQAAAAPRCLLARALHIAADKFWFSVVFYLTPEGPVSSGDGSRTGVLVLEMGPRRGRQVLQWSSSKG